MPARGHSPRTILGCRREPEPDEAARGAEVVFVRLDHNGNEVNILAFLTEDGQYSQYGADADTLWDNVPDVEEWREERLEELAP
jgi:hypothetical protein